MLAPRLHLTLLADRLAVARLAPDTPVPAWAWEGPLASVTRTPGELSVVTLESAVPPEVRAERGWRVFALEGPIPFTSTGILASLMTPLAEARISIFALSSYDTDFVFVREADVARARAALERAGHTVAGP